MFRKKVILKHRKVHKLKMVRRFSKNKNLIIRLFQHTLNFVFLLFYWIFSTDLSVFFGFFRLGQIGDRLKLGKKHTFGIGNGAEFRPQIRVIERLGDFGCLI